MPVFWANENAELSDEDADLLIRLVETKITSMNKSYELQLHYKMIS